MIPVIPSVHNLISGSNAYPVGQINANIPRSFVSSESEAQIGSEERLGLEANDSNMGGTYLSS